MKWLQSFDEIEIKRLEESGRARSVKRGLMKDGYTWAMSLYGAVQGPGVDEIVPMRVEILSDTEYTERIVYLITSFFETVQPVDKYTIWIFDGVDETLTIQGKWS